MQCLLASQTRGIYRSVNLGSLSVFASKVVYGVRYRLAFLTKQIEWVLCGVTVLPEYMAPRKLGAKGGIEDMSEVREKAFKSRFPRLLTWLQ